jgi:hypothetical protein
MKKMKKKKNDVPAKPRRIFLETLEGYIEAARVKQLTEFTKDGQA